MNTRIEHEQPRSLDAWLSYLEQIHSQEIDMGLDRISAVAGRMGVLTPSAKVITVAGTNGKGSSVALLDATLRAAGHTTACFTSPHLVDYRERVLVNGNMLTEQAHCDAFRTVNEARGEISLTYFEFGTLAALWLIEQSNVDVAILEIGLGGRLDAVNIVEPDLSIVTSVDIDHIGFLGNDREQIGFEKAGIFRADKPAICGDPNPPLRLLEHAQAIGAQLLCVGRDYAAQDGTSDNGSWQFTPCSEAGLTYLTGIKNLPQPLLPRANALGVIAGLQLAGFKVSEQHIAAGLVTAAVAGRFEVWGGQPTVILDVAHNPHAARYLSQKLQQLRAEKGQKSKFVAVCGMLADKDITATLRELKSDIDHWHFATLDGPRAATAETLVECLGATDTVATFETIAMAYQAALREATSEDVIICFGSFLTVAAMYKLKGRSING